jgi:hypothetical protein
MEEDNLHERQHIQQQPIQVEPELYSEMAIWGFSVFITPIFGGILMAMNIPGWKGKMQAVVFSVVYTLAAVYISFFLLPIPVLGIILNGVGAWLITYLFWDKYIGRATRFRPRPILIPLIIALIIFVVPMIVSSILLVLR